MGPALKTLHDAFLDELRDAFDFEDQIVGALPEIAVSVQSPALRAVLEVHRDETRLHLSRLTQVFTQLGETARGTRCAGIAGILDDSRQVMAAKDLEPPAKDARLIAGCQRIEHFEIAAYSTLVTWAQKLGHVEAEALLQESLEEERAAYELLSDFTEAAIDVDTTGG